jgi:hypothetical protein
VHAGGARLHKRSSSFKRASSETLFSFAEEMFSLTKTFDSGSYGNTGSNGWFCFVGRRRRQFAVGVCEKRPGEFGLARTNCDFIVLQGRTLSLRPIFRQ